MFVCCPAGTKGSCVYEEELRSFYCFWRAAYLQKPDALISLIRCLWIWFLMCFWLGSVFSLVAFVAAAFLLQKTLDQASSNWIWAIFSYTQRWTARPGSGLLFLLLFDGWAKPKRIKPEVLLVLVLCFYGVFQTNDVGYNYIYHS